MRSPVSLFRRSGMGKALDYLHLEQAAFYAGNQDVTEERVLADLAHHVGAGRGMKFGDLTFIAA